MLPGRALCNHGRGAAGVCRAHEDGAEATVATSPGARAHGGWKRQKDLPGPPEPAGGGGPAHSPSSGSGFQSVKG